jgi:hypothetical protein
LNSIKLTQQNLITERRLALLRNPKEINSIASQLESNKRYGIDQSPQIVRTLETESPEAGVIKHWKMNALPIALPLHHSTQLNNGIAAIISTLEQSQQIFKELDDRRLIESIPEVKSPVLQGGRRDNLRVFQASISN